jgi:hypothetical protein
VALCVARGVVGAEVTATPCAASTALVAKGAAELESIVLVIDEDWKRSRSWLVGVCPRLTLLPGRIAGIGGLLS